MAEKNPSFGTSACLMCLEQPDALKILPNCKHVFCCNCLADYLEKQMLGDTGSLTCPTCQTACPIPGGNVHELIDYEEGEEEAALAQSPVEGDVVRVPCRNCIFSRGKNVDAEILCEECGSLYLCRGCTAIHKKNKATASHVVISLKKKTKKGVCRVHRDLINSYCSSCGEPCCHLCVLLEHGDHNITKIGDVFHTLVDEITTLTDEQERRSADLKRFEPQLRFLEASEMTERQDVLIAETEDQAEKCMDHIVQQKESRIGQIKDDHKVVTDVVQCLGRLSTLGTLDKTVAKAKGMVTQTETHPQDIENLSAVKQQIMDCQIKSDINMESFWENYKRFYDNPIHFKPNPATAINIGTLQGKPRPTNLWNVNSLKSIFEKKMTVDNQAKFIPCVANLGHDFYAVAHPVVGGNKSDALDIYKFPGELQQTFRDHVSPIYDMAATFCGQLAILSSGTTPDTCSVRFFDPEAGYVRSTGDLPVANPLSFDINSRGQYVILNNEGGRKIHIVNEDGSVDLSHSLSDRYVRDPCRIACSGVHYYLSGTNEVFSIYKRHEKQMKFLKTSSGTIATHFALKDVSVTAFDRIMVCFGQLGYYPYVGRDMYNLATNQLQPWSSVQISKLATNGANAQMRLAVREGCDYTLWSQGQTIRVYEG